MLKKILSGILALGIMVLSVFTFSGCSSKVKDFSVDAITSNGGIGLIKDGYMYYIAGGTDKLDDPASQMIEASSIYRRQVDEKGNPIEGSTPELIYSGIAGFERGGLYAFGEYLYFTTPSGFVTSKAEKMTDRTSFCRIRMDGKKYKVLYTTETADDLSFAYYTPTNEELYISILEGKELYSYNVRKDKVIEIASDVTSAVFSTEFGRGNGADPYIFYTKAPSETYLTQNGNMVYRTNVLGEDNKQISSGEDIKLLQIKFGYLYFSVDDKIFKTTTSAGLDRTNVVSYKAYDNPIFTANGGLVAKGSEDGKKQLIYAVWETGSKVNGKILATSESYEAYFVDGETLYAVNADKKLVRLALNYGATETAKDTIIKDQVTVKISDSLSAEKIGDYLYYYVETKTTDDNGNEIKTWNIESVKV